MIKGILFDLDGVLVDAVDWHYQSLNQALSLFGYAIKKEEHELKYNGLPTSVKLRKLSNDFNLPLSLHSFINEMKQRYTLTTIKKRCLPNPKISEILNTLVQQGYSLALCSNSNRNTVDTVLEQMGIRNYFEVVLSTNDVLEPKPNPEIYHRAMTLLGLEPEECLAIEDSAPGIESARASQAHILQVLNPSVLSLSVIEEKILKLDGGLRKKNRRSISPKPIEIIIPMAGLGTRFSEAGYIQPKPLIPVFDKPMIQWVVDNIRPQNFKAHFTFICNEEHLRTMDVENLLRRLEPNCTIVPVKNVTAGAACTVLLAKDRLSTNHPVIVANSDQWVNFEIDAFIRDAQDRNVDGSILTFKATDKKWSYARLDNKNELVIEVAEKKAISSHATVGIYFFKESSALIDGIQNMIRKEIRTNGEFYLCPVYNELIGLGKKIAIYEIPPFSMHGLGTPEDLTLFLEKNG